ncbi:MAG: ribonuclease PH, partial [Nakamurella sp.]
GTIVEVQGTGEGATFSRSTMNTMIDLALAGIEELTASQRAALTTPYPKPLPERASRR